MEAKNEVTSLEVKDLPEGYADDMVLEQYHTYPIIRDEFNIIRWASLKSLLPPPLDMLDIPFSKLIRDSHLKDNEICRRLAERLDGRSLSSYGDVFNMECNRVSDDSFTPPTMAEFLNAVFDFIDAIASIKNIKDIKSQNDVFLPITDAILKNHLGDVNILEDHPDGLGKLAEVVYEGCCVDFYVLLVRFMDVLQQGKIMILYHVGEYSFTITLAAELISGLMHKYVRNGRVVSVPTTGEIVGICVDNEQVKYYLKTAISYIDENIGREGEISFINSLDVRMALSI